MNDTIVVENLAVSLDGETKKELSGELKKHRLIHSKFTGKIVINLNQGGITVVERMDSVK